MCRGVTVRKTTNNLNGDVMTGLNVSPTVLKSLKFSTLTLFLYDKICHFIHMFCTQNDRIWSRCFRVWSYVSDQIEKIHS
jgi:hypothetical protein